MRTAATFMRRGYYGRGVGVAGPNPRYFSSMAARIAASDLPSLFICITSRVMSRHNVQVAAWLVKGTRPARPALTWQGGVGVGADPARAGGARGRPGRAGV